MVELTMFGCLCLAWLTSRTLGLPSDYHRVKKSIIDLPKPDIYSLEIDSTIMYRYAQTKVTSKVVNPANASQEVHFNLLLPDTAFITTFVMEINGKKYKSFVKEKEIARIEYQEAVAGGQTAAHVALSARDSNKFTVSVNVEPAGKVYFILTYEELLTRTLGMYNHVINLNPGQVVRDLTVNVHIDESAPITKLHVPEIRSTNEVVPENEEKENSIAEIKLVGKTEAYIKYSPSAEEQIQMLNQQNEGESKGLGGQLVVQYDVEREPEGQVLVNEGYFVHFFSPEDLPPLRKLAVFVLDVSGSMEGRKLEQLKQAMSRILDDLGPNDYFNIIEFSYSVTVHNLDSATGSVVLAPDTALGIDGEMTFTREGPRATPQAYLATPSNIKKAKHIIQKMSSGGGTNINDALKNAIIVARTGYQTLLRTGSENGTDIIKPIIIFLTDGDPTVGITKPKRILSMVKELNHNSTCAIFSLGFGDGADLNFLRKLSLANAGFARNIYEASDAALQLNNFYKEIASPLLSNVSFNYPPEQVKEITKNNFQSLFLGSELVVAGKLIDDETSFNVAVEAITANGTMEFHPQSIRDSPDIITDIKYIDERENIRKAEEKKKKKRKPSTMERLWAYLTIKQLLDRYELVDENSDEKRNENVKEKALKLALKYKFVTPLTSLVVIKPNETTEIDLDTMKPSDTFLRRGGLFLQSSLVAGSSHLPLPSDMDLLPLSFVGSIGQKTFVERIETVDWLDDTVPLTIDNIEWFSEAFITENNTLPVPLEDKSNLKYYSVSFNATDASYQDCSYKERGHCKHLVNCVMVDFIHSIEDFYPFFCSINDRFVGVCCPNNSTDSTVVPMDIETTTYLPLETTMLV